MNMTRREFCKTSAAGMAGILASGMGPSLYAAGANDRIRVACVGYSDRFRGSLLPCFLHHNKELNFDLVAVADLWKKRLNERAKPELEKKLGHAVATYPSDVALYENAKDVDAVIISTADFQHAQHAAHAVVAGKDAYFVHALMPWTGATRALPTDGTRWYALASAYAHKWSGRIGGASVHEFGHGAHLTFRLSDEDVRKVRLGALRAAAGDYLRARAKWESADFWDDPHLGDRAFYAEVVKPLTAELDAAAKEFCANEGELSSEEVAKLVRTRFAAWAEFEMNVERARAAYLLNSQDFFGQDE